MRHTPPGQDFRRPTGWRRNQALGPFAAFADARKTLAASKTERAPGARRGRRAYRRSLSRRTREKVRLGQGGAATLSRRAKEKPCQGGGRARPARIPGARRRRFRHSVSHVGGGRCASCARRKRKQLSRYAQAPLQAEALQSAANTRKHKNCSEKTEDGSKLASCGGFVKPSGAPNAVANSYHAEFPDGFTNPCGTVECSCHATTFAKRNFLDALPTPVRSSNAVAKLHSSCQAEFPRCICETQRGRQMQSQTLIMRSSPVDLPNPVGLSNAVAKWNFSPGSGVSSVNSQTPTGLSNAAARWNLSPGGEDFSVHLPRTAGSSNAVARRQPSPSGVPRWIYQTLQDCRIQLRGGKPCWAEVPRCICESQRDRQMQPPGRTSRQAAESPR